MNLAKNYNTISLIKFAIPNILSLVFMSMYQMVDGIFISNYVGENALAAINIVYPIPSIVLALSLMLAVGGSAIVAKKLGEEKLQEAREDFSLISLTGFIIGVLFSIITYLFMKPLLHFLGASELLYQDCYDYLMILNLLMPFAVLQLILQSFFLTEGKPKIGFSVTLLSGICNIVFDYLFIVKLDWGVKGAAVATTMGYCIAAIISILYFAYNRNGHLNFVRPKANLKMLASACLNGSSEMVSNLAASVTTLLFNKMMLAYLGEAGVSAITVVLYAQFLLTAVFMGFIGGISPVFSYCYGQQDYLKINKYFRISFYTTLIFSVLTVLSATLLATPIIRVFIHPSSEVFQITYHGFKLFAIGYLFAGFNIYASGLFTALLNGKASALISLLRTFVFLVGSLVLLPIMIGADGIWLAVPVAEFFSFLVAVYLLFQNRKTYRFTLRPPHSN